MKKLHLLLIIGIVLFACESTGQLQERAPGVETMKKYGTRMNPAEVLDMIGESIRSLSGGYTAYSLYNEILNSSNTNPVFVISSIEYNNDGLATKIEGRVEVPRTIREFVIKGGMGTPVYEAVEPNEFGLIFGRRGNIAVREGVIVKTNTLESAEIYKLVVGSVTYDKISEASVLFQSLEVARTPYLKNMIVELEGMVMNSESKGVILEAMRTYKAENPNATDEDVVLYVLSQETYLNELKRSNEAARARIKKSAELVNTITTACALKSVEIAEIFTVMAIDIASLFRNPMAAPGMIASYVARNLPSGSDMQFSDLDNIQKYGDYQLRKYNQNLQRNNALWERAYNLSVKL